MQFIVFNTAKYFCHEGLNFNVRECTIGYGCSIISIIMTFENANSVTVVQNNSSWDIFHLISNDLMTIRQYMDLSRRFGKTFAIYAHQVRG